MITVYLKETNKPKTRTRYKNLIEAVGRLTLLGVENYTLIEVDNRGRERVVDSNNLPPEFNLGVKFRT